MPIYYMCYTTYYKYNAPRYTYYKYNASRLAQDRSRHTLVPVGTQPRRPQALCALSHHHSSLCSKPSRGS